MLVDILGSILSKLEKNIWRKFCSRTFNNLENAKLFTLLLLLLVLSPHVTFVGAPLPSNATCDSVTVDVRLAMPVPSGGLVSWGRLGLTRFPPFQWFIAFRDHQIG